MKIHAELLLQQLITRRDKTGHYWKIEKYRVIIYELYERKKIELTFIENWPKNKIKLIKNISDYFY